MKNKLLNIFLGFMLLLGASAAGRAQQQRPAQGTLKLTGEHIERIVLLNEKGRSETYRPEGDTISLPAGKYRLNEVRLKGEYRYLALGEPEQNSIIVEPNKPTAFNFGAPLKSSMTVMRQGRVLVLNYGLTGIGGEEYTSQARADKRPSFKIYKGDKQIASGQFEYG